MDSHQQSLSLTKSTPIKACITIAIVIHIGDKALIVLRFYPEIAVAAAQVTAAFGNADNAV